MGTTIHSGSLPDRTSPEFAIGYTRVSTLGQQANGGSLGDQRVAIEAFAEAMDYTLIEVFEETASGVGERSLYKRSNLKAALELARQQDAYLLVWDWDRLSRHSGFQDQFKKAYPDLVDRVVCVRTANQLRSASHAAGFVHANERAKRISEATKAALAKKRDQGVTFGNPQIRTTVQPLGTAAFSLKRKELDEQVASVLRDRPDAFTMTRRTASELMNNKGVTTLQGKLWTPDRMTGPLKRAREILRSEEDEEAVRLNPAYGAF